MVYLPGVNKVYKGVTTFTSSTGKETRCTTLLVDSCVQTNTYMLMKDRYLKIFVLLTLFVVYIKDLRTIYNDLKGSLCLCQA